MTDLSELAKFIQEQTGEPCDASDIVHVRYSKDEATKLPKRELRRHFDMCIRDTAGLKPDDLVGFIVGFRMYERMAMKLGKQITEEESRRFVPVSLPAPIEPPKTDWSHPGDPRADVERVTEQALNDVGYKPIENFCLGAKWNCEDCLYTGKLCDECRAAWELANREV